LGRIARQAPEGRDRVHRRLLRPTGGNPIAAAQGISFPTYPNATRGSRLKVKPGQGWYAQGGAYLVYSGFANAEDHGVELGAPEGSGVLALGEFGYLVGRYSSGRGLPGKYKIGGYYDSEELHDQKTGEDDRGTWGIDAMGEQMSFSENDRHQEGLSVLVALSYAPPDLNLVQFMAGGLTFKGPFKGRPGDAVSLIAAYGDFSSDLASGQRAEQESVLSGEGLVEINRPGPPVCALAP